MTETRVSDTTRTYTQHRRWLKTSFRMTRRQLDYSVASKDDAALQKKIAWDTIGPRAGYVRTIEADRELRWICFVLTLLAAAASLRGGPQPLTFLLYLGVTLTLIAGALMTRRFRCLAYTAVPAAGLNMLVLDDRQHDAIMSEIETRRRAALLKATEPTAGLSIRAYLRRSRWLAENDVLTREEFLQRQRLVLPDHIRPLLTPETSGTPPQRFVQRRPGARITIDLLADRLIYKRETWFNGAESFSVFYRDLQEPSVFHQTDYQHELLIVLLGWVCIGTLGWMSALGAGHPPDYYVGGIGLKRAIADYGPALLILIAACGTLPLVTRLRCAQPWSGIILLRDKQHDTLLAAIDHRRIAARRQLAEPDPLLALDEQMQTLEELREAEIISDAEFRHFASEAEKVCDNPALDLPVMEDAPKERDHALH